MGSLQCLVKLKANGNGRQEVSTSITLLTKLQVLSLAGCKAGESNSRNLVLSLRSSPTEGLPLPSLSGLCSLKMLMNKWPQPIGRSPTQWFWLLIFIRTIRSEKKQFHYCAWLPQKTHTGTVQKSSLIARASIKYSRFMGHTSLETFSYPSSAYALKKSRFIFYCYSCFRLVGNEQSDSVEAILLGIRVVA